MSIYTRPPRPIGSSTPFPSPSLLNRVTLDDSAGIGGNTLYKAVWVFKLYPKVAFVGARP
jgi:hypothetical protein